MLEVMNILKKSRLFIVFLAFALVFTSINMIAFAEPSKQVVSVNEKRVLNLSVADITTNETYSTSLLLLPGAEWDESVLNQLNNNYVLTNYELRALNPNETAPPLVVGSNGIIRLFAIETIFDIGCFTMSLAEFAIEPTFWNGFWVVADGLSMAFPGIPALSGVKRMIKASSVLTDATKIGIKPYKELQKITVPTEWQRHHIFEQRFASRLGTTSGDMLAIPIPANSTYHQAITNKMRSKIPYATDLNTLTKNEILDAHIEAYKELWDSTNDEVWEFLYKFAQNKQYK